MIRPFLIFLTTLLLSITLYAGNNFSEMSTQELISIMGYVKPAEQKKFKGELESRVPSMSASEKKAYEENLKKLK